MRHSPVRNLVLAALLAALTAVVAQLRIPLPGNPVPFTLQVLAVLLAGGLLAPFWAFAAMGIYLLLGAIGLPVFAGGTGGLQVLMGPTGGYLWSYPLAAALVAALAPAHKAPGGLRTALAMLPGLALIYAGGAGWAVLLGGKAYAAVINGWVLPFIPFDLLKLLLAQLVCTEVNRALATHGLAGRQAAH